MKTIEDLINKLNENSITVDQYKEDEKLCGYELNTYTNGGANQIIFLDFRDTQLDPANAEDFLNTYAERVESIDIDEEIELNRQDKSYRDAFTLADSVADFTEWKERLEGIFADNDPEKQILYRGDRIYLTVPDSNTGKQETYLLMLFINSFNTQLNIVHIDGYYVGHMFMEKLPKEEGHVGITIEALKAHLETYYKGCEFDSSTLKLLPREKGETRSIIVE